MSMSVGTITGELLLNDKWSKPIKDAEKATKGFSDSAEKELNDVDNAAQQTQDGMNQLLSAFAAFEGVKFMASAAVGFAKMGAELEQTRVSMEVFLGSAEKADQVIRELNQFSAVTPFTSDQVVQAGKSLLAFGLEAEKLQDTLRAVGDVSAATGKDFNELATIYGKAMTQGVIQAEEINQLTEAGVPIIGELAKNLGVAEDQIKKMASQGKIGFKELEEAFQTLTGEGGKFFNLMEKQSQTAAGLMSTLQGVVEQLGAEISEQMLNAAKPALMAVVEASTVLLDTWNNLDDDTKELIATLVLVNGTLVFLGATVIAAKVAYTAAMAAMAASNTAFMATLGPIGAAMALVTAGVIAYHVAIKKARSETDKAIDAYNRTTKSLNTLTSELQQMSKLSKDSAKYGEIAAQAMERLAESAESYGVAVDKTNRDLDYMIQKQKEVQQAAENTLKANRGMVEMNAMTTLLDLSLGRNARVAQIASEALVRLGEAGTDASAKMRILSETTDRINNATDMFSRNQWMRDLENISIRYTNIQNAIDDMNNSMDNSEPPEGAPGTDGFNNAVERSVLNIREMERAAQDMQAELAKIKPDKWAKIGDEFQELSDMGPLAYGISEITQAFDVAESTAKAFGTEAANALGKLADAYMDSLNAMEEATQAKLQKNADIASLLGEVAEAEMKKKHEKELELLDQRYESEIKLMRDAALERKLLEDEELAEKKRRLEAELEAELEKERILFEQKKQMLMEQSADEEQARLARQVMENDWVNYVERRNEELNKRLQEEDSKSAEEKQRIESQLQTNITALQDSQQTERESIKQQQLRQEKEHTKKMAIVQYAYELFAYESAKRVAIATAGFKFADSIMSAVQAGAAMAAIFPPITAPLGAALTAALVAMSAQAYNASIATIHAQKPLPPATLFMQEGGVVQGRLHSQGGVPAEVEAGEMVVSRNLTTRVEQMVSRDESGQRGSNVIIQSGAIVVNGSVDDRMVDMIAEKIGQQIEQRRL